MNNNTETTMEVVKGFRNIKLEGVESLTATKYVATYEIVRQLNPKNKKPIKMISKTLVNEETEEVVFYLEEVTLRELANLRKGKAGGFVLKNEGRYFYAEIPKHMNFVDAKILGSHKCADAEHVCQRLTPLADEEGGCAKVRGYAKYIERYPFITKGYETFNMSHNTFLVAHCEHFEAHPPRPKMSITRTNAQKLELARFVWPDVKNLEEVRRRKATSKYGE